MRSISILVLAFSTSLAAAASLVPAAATRALGARDERWNLATPKLAPSDRMAELEGWHELSCARCHVEITREWAGSMHGLAWVDALYQEQLADMKRPESCHGCHAPMPLFVDAKAGKVPQKPEPRASLAQSGVDRDKDVHFGVSCASCHAGPGGEVLGPFGAATDAHVSKKHAAFDASKSNELCIACHATTVGPVIGIAKDFVDTKQAEAGRSCVGCHMQAVERPIANAEAPAVSQPPAGTGGAAPAASAAYASRPGRSHALQTPLDPSFLRRALRIDVAVRGGKTVVRFTNDCGHRVPGLVTRVLEMRAELLDESGTKVATGSLTIDKARFLPADQALELELAGVGASVKLTGTHDFVAFEAPVTFLDETLAVKPR